MRTAEQINAQLEALEREWQAGDIGFGNYKRVVQVVLDLFEDAALDMVALEKRVAALETPPQLPKAGSFHE